MNEFNNGSAMEVVYKRVPEMELSLETVRLKLTTVNPDTSKFILVKGDVCKTTKCFVDENPGFRISLLYIDLDLNEPVYHSLMHLWDRIIPGGILYLMSMNFINLMNQLGSIHF